MELEIGLPKACGAHELIGHALGRRPLSSWLLGGPSPVVLFVFIYSGNNLRKFSAQSENFYFCTKTTP